MDHERTQEKEYEQDRSVVYVLLIDAMWLCTDYRIYGKYGSQWPGSGKSGCGKVQLEILPQGGVVLVNN